MVFREIESLPPFFVGIAEDDVSQRALNNDENEGRDNKRDNEESVRRRSVLRSERRKPQLSPPRRHKSRDDANDYEQSQKPTINLSTLLFEQCPLLICFAITSSS
jgi:hypothetical protein